MRPVRLRATGTKYIMLVIFLLILTEFYRVIAVVLSVPLSFVSGLLLVILLIFLVSNRRTTAYILTNKSTIRFVAILSIWPIATSLYSIAPLKTPTIEKASIACVFVAALVLFIEGGLQGARNLFRAAALVTFCGALVSWFAPDLFVDMGTAASTNLNYDGRAFGLFLQPNVLGISMCFIMLSWYVAEENKNQTFLIIWLCIVALTVLISGSRFAILTMTLIVLMIYLFHNSKRRVSFNYRLIKLLQFIIVFIALYGSAKFVFNYFDLKNLALNGNVYDRIDSLLNFQIFHSEDSLISGSLALRQAAQAEYLRLVQESPLVGQGLGTQAMMLAHGILELSSHSSALAMAVDFGVPYVIVFCVILIASLSKRKTKDLWSKVGLNVGWVFLLAFLPSYFFNHGLIENRFFFVILAFAFALCCFPFVFAKSQGKNLSVAVERSRAPIQNLHACRRMYGI